MNQTRRLACIDIGTNSVLLLVADRSEDGHIEPVADLAEITRLGKGVDSSGLLDPEAVLRTLETVRVFTDKARQMGAVRVMAVGTSALREASNASDFLKPAEQITGEPVRVISGELEAEYSFASIAADSGLGELSDPVVMADVGGGSTELVEGIGGRINRRVSIDIGAVRLTERALPSNPVRPEELAAARQMAQAILEPYCSQFTAGSLTGIGGTIVNLANIALGGPGHNTVHGHRLPVADVGMLVENLASLPLDERRKVQGLEEKRADVITAGAVIFETLGKLLKKDEIIVSTRGARFGALALMESGQ